VADAVEIGVSALWTERLTFVGRLDLPSEGVLQLAVTGCRTGVLGKDAPIFTGMIRQEEHE
jgi:hypothetical protein